MTKVTMKIFDYVWPYLDIFDNKRHQKYQNSRIWQCECVVYTRMQPGTSDLYMYCVGTISTMTWNPILFCFRMEKSMGTHNYIQFCVNMETYNSHQVVIPINGQRHVVFGHRKMPEKNGNESNMIKIYESLYIIHTCAFGYHEMWLGCLGRHSNWTNSNHTPDLIGNFRQIWELEQVITHIWFNVHIYEWYDRKSQYHSLITIKYMQLWDKVLHIIVTQ